VFVNSMSDLFHRDVPATYIERVWWQMALAHQHTFQVLTKRPKRMRQVVRALYGGEGFALAALGAEAPLPNVWLGTSIETNTYVSRADHLRATPAAVRFVSAEPLLGALNDLELDGIDWLIAGGESGSGHRPVDPGWVRDLRDRCQAAGVAFFFKQWGGRTPKSGGRELDGRTWDEMPRAFRRRPRRLVVRCDRAAAPQRPRRGRARGREHQGHPAAHRPASCPATGPGMRKIVVLEADVDRVFPLERIEPRAPAPRPRGACRRRAARPRVVVVRLSGRSRGGRRG
jgi:protein gp37